MQNNNKRTYLANTSLLVETATCLAMCESMRNDRITRNNFRPLNALTTLIHFPSLLKNSAKGKIEQMSTQNQNCKYWDAIFFRSRIHSPVSSFWKAVLNSRHMSNAK